MFPREASRESSSSQAGVGEYLGEDRRVEEARREERSAVVEEVIAERGKNYQQCPNFGDENGAPPPPSRRASVGGDERSGRRRRGTLEGPREGEGRKREREKYLKVKKA